MDMERKCSKCGDYTWSRYEDLCDKCKPKPKQVYLTLRGTRDGGDWVVSCTGPKGKEECVVRGKPDATMDWVRAQIAEQVHVKPPDQLFLRFSDGRSIPFPN